MFLLAPSSKQPFILVSLEPKPERRLSYSNGQAAIYLGIAGTQSPLSPNVGFHIQVGRQPLILVSLEPSHLLVSLASSSRQPFILGSPEKAQPERRLTYFIEQATIHLGIA